MSVLDADHGCVPLSRCPTAPQQAPMAPISPYQAPRHHGDLQPSTPRLLNPINSEPRTCVFFGSRPNPGTLVLQGPASRSLIHSLFLQPESARATRDLPPLWSRNLRASELSALLGFKTPSASCARPRAKVRPNRAVFRQLLKLYYPILCRCGKEASHSSPCLAYTPR